MSREQVHGETGMRPAAIVASHRLDGLSGATSVMEVTA